MAIPAQPNLLLKTSSVAKVQPQAAVPGVPHVVELIPPQGGELQGRVVHKKLTTLLDDEKDQEHTQNMAADGLTVVRSDAAEESASWTEQLYAWVDNSGPTAISEGTVSTQVASTSMKTMGASASGFGSGGLMALGGLGAAAGGGGSSSRSSTPTATPANTNAPINTVPDAQSVDRDTDLVIAGLSVTDPDPGGSVSVTLRVTYGAIRVAGATGVVQSGTDDNITLTGTLADVNAALAATNAVVYRGNLAYVGADTLSIKTSDGGNPALSDVDSVAITINAAPLTGTQVFTLWQEAESAWTELQANGSTMHDINALNTYSSIITTQHDTTSADGTANGRNALSQYINQVTGTDIVSQAEVQAGFAITGKAAAGAQGTIAFYLDNDRTDGVNDMGEELQDGINGVHISYDNATGDYRISFDANSGALLPATHNTYGSGIHQLTVDTNGDGSKKGSGTTLEASRLFLVADGTASSADTGTVAQNYSAQDTVTNDVFVYYYGDPDGAGIGLWTAIDNGDSANNPGVVSIDHDADTSGYGDWDYYGLEGNAAGTLTTSSNTALHLVTDIDAQTWEFHMANNTNWSAWDEADAQATDHTGFGSNTSRQASLAEVVAVYAANFGGDNAGGNTVGAVQAMSNVGSTNGYRNAEENRPDGWDSGMWSAAPTPSGYAILYLSYGDVDDSPATDGYYVTAVL